MATRDYHADPPAIQCCWGHLRECTEPLIINIRDQQHEIERLRSEVAAYERLVRGMEQMIKSFEGCSVIGRWKPYASHFEAGGTDDPAR